MQITTNQFIEAIWQSNISLNSKKNIIWNLENFTMTQFEEIYKILLQNVEEQKKIIKRFKRKDKMLNLKFEMQIKSEIKSLKV